MLGSTDWKGSLGSWFCSSGGMGIPVEGSPHGVARLRLVAEVVVIDHVDHRTHDGLAVLSDAVCRTTRTSTQRIRARAYGPTRTTSTQGVHTTALVKVKYISSIRVHLGVFGVYLLVVFGVYLLVVFGVYLPSNGGSQLTLASQWESRKVMTSPVAAAAPRRRVLISPSLFLVRKIRTFGKRVM